MKQKKLQPLPPGTVVSGKYIQGFGPSNAKIMLVSDFPDDDEDKLGEGFVGQRGKLIDGILKEAGIDGGIKACYKTFAIKFHPPMGNLKLLHVYGRSVDEHKEQLVEEIRAINPVVIIPMGEIALNTVANLTKIGNWRGSILKYRGTGLPKVVPTLDPGGLLKFSGKGSLPWSARAYITLDFKRASEESLFRELRLPQRLLQVCRNSKQLFDFIRQYRSAGKTKVSVDIESHMCIPTCIAIAFNRHHAMSVPLLNLSATIKIPDADFVDIWRQLAELLEDPAIELIGQNFKYDEQKLRSPVGIRCGRLFMDTSLAAHTLYPEFPKSLAFLTSIHTREPYYKDDGKDFDPRTDSGDKIYIYNARDAAVTFEISEVLEKELSEVGTKEFYFNYVNKRHKLYCKLERRGFRVDTKVRTHLQNKYKERLETELEELFSLVGRRFKFNAPATVAKILYTELGIPTRSDTTEDTLIALLANTVKDPRHRRIIELELSVRRVSKLLSTYLCQPLDGDGRIRSSFNICGTETGRRATQILKPPVRMFQTGMAFSTMTNHGEIGSELRSMLIADEGCKIIGVDESQAEARIVALLSNDEETLRLFDTTDIHRLTAGWCFGLTHDQAMKLAKDSPMRFVGKTTRHAGNYGMGKRTLMLNIQTEAKRNDIKIDISEKQAGEILDKFHKRTPKIRQVFHAEVGIALRRTRCLINPYGRRRDFFDRYSDGMLREGFAQIPQSTSQELIIEAMCDFEKKYPDIPIINETHDSFDVMCPENAEKEVSKYMVELVSREIDFKNCTLPRGKLVIPGESDSGYNYRDMTKVVV